jgi:hypothetical protein
MLNRRGFGRFIAEAVSWAGVCGFSQAFAQSDSRSLSQECDTTKPLTLDDLSSLLPTGQERGEPRYQVFAYYYPAWHRDPDLAARIGRDPGWTEWSVLRDAKPVTPCEIEPKHPLWGNYENSDPTNVEREIDAAADANIDAFMFDWYYNNGDTFYVSPLNNGFLKAKNQTKIKFALMWTNADTPIWTFDYLRYDFDGMTSYFLEHYAGLPNYMKLRGNPVFGIFNVTALMTALGVGNLRRQLEAMRTRALRAGFGGLYIVASEAYGPDDDLAEMGFDAATKYHTFYGGSPGTSSYRDAAIKTVRSWLETARTQKVPIFPDCPVGWDDSPRRGATTHAVLSRSAMQYGELLAAAKRFVSECSIDPPVIFLSSWNEWTEDHYLVPDEAYGNSYLDAVRQAFAGRR